MNRCLEFSSRGAINYDLLPHIVICSCRRIIMAILVQNPTRINQYMWIYKMIFSGSVLKENHGEIIFDGSSSVLTQVQVVSYQIRGNKKKLQIPNRERR